MSLSFLKLGKIAGLLFVGALALTLSGCGPEDTTGDVPKPPVKQAPQYIVKTVPRPDASGEFQRVETYLLDGTTLVKLQIDYRDGRTEIQLFRKDGTMEEQRWLHPHTDKLKSSTKFAADGKTRLEETTYRMAGVLETKTEFLSDGSEKSQRYRSDGKRVYSESLKDKSGKKVSTFYGPDGVKVWAKAVEQSNGDSRVETYRDNGDLDQVREVFQDHKDITVYADGGKIKYKQTWSGYRSGYGYYYSYYSLANVDEYNDDGVSVKRKLEFYRWGDRYVTKATDIVNGKPTKVRSFRYDGTLEKEVIYKDDGTIDKTVPHTSSEKITEAFDPVVRDEPRYTDPLDGGNANFN